jgi:CBS domain-containing protein
MQPVDAQGSTDERRGSMTGTVARDIMNPDVLKVRVGWTVRELASFLTNAQISGAPVEDERGRLVGVVSVTDIVSANTAGSPAGRDQSNPDFYVRGWEDRLDMSEMSGFQIESASLTVKEIMTPAIYKVDDKTTVSEVARTMLSAHLHRLLVTRGEQVVGIITTSDLLQLLV